MELFNNVNPERLISIAENYINDILEDRGNNVDDLASAFSNAGFTKSEFFKILDKYYLNDYRWVEETALTAPTPITAPTVEEVNIGEVIVGDSDQAILETALAQVGISYSYEQINDDNGNVFERWIDLKITDGDYVTDNTAARIFFTQEGKYKGIN